MNRARLLAVLLLLGSLSSWGFSVSAQPKGVAWESSFRLGVTVRALSFETLASLGLDYGVEVVAVFPHSPADQAGFKREDIVVEWGGRPVYSVARLRWLVSREPAAEEIAVRTYRRGEIETVKVGLGVSKAPRRSVPSWDMGRWPTASYLGVRLQTMTDELREVFGAPKGHGVLIVKISAASPAARAELAVGDVIVKMGSKRIRRIWDVYRVLNFFDPGDAVEVEIVRDRQRRTLVVALEKAADLADVTPRGHEWWYAPYWLAPLLHPKYWQEPLEEFLEKWEELWKESPPYPHEHTWGYL